jgi:hypothetical protein
LAGSVPQGDPSRNRGIRALDPPRTLDRRWGTYAPFEIVEKLTAPEGLGIVEGFRLSLTTARLRSSARSGSDGGIVGPLRLSAQGVAVPRGADGQPSDGFEEGSRLDRL